MQHTPTLTDTQTLRKARSILQEYVPLEATGYQCQSQHLYDVLLATCASGQPLEAVCRDLVEAPEADTVRSYLNEQLTLEALPQLEQQLNQARSADLPPRLLRKPQKLAIDFHDRPYYGKAAQETAPWVRGRAKDGTTRFFRIATAYVIHRGLRLTLALHFVLPEEDTVTVLKALLRRISALAVPVGCLLLDKGFAGIETMQYLSTQRLAALIACPIRGKKAQALRGRCARAARATAQPSATARPRSPPR